MAFLRMNWVLFADDVVVTSEEVTMRWEEFRYWQAEMNQANGNIFQRINVSDNASRSTSGNWILDSGASTRMVNIQAHRRVVHGAVAGITFNHYDIRNTDAPVRDLDEDDDEDEFWDLLELLDNDDIILQMPKLTLEATPSTISEAMRQKMNFNYLDFKATRGFDLDARFKWDDDDDDDDCSSMSVRIVENGRSIQSISTGQATTCNGILPFPRRRRKILRSSSVKF
jgi:hypothetical protein